MSHQFQLRLAKPADAHIVAWHRARMFQDMGDVPTNLFDPFRAKSREHIREVLASGEYIGWLASPAEQSHLIIGGAGAHIRRVLPHPLVRRSGEVSIAEGRHAIIQNVFTEPDWRRQGVAALLVQRIIIWAQQERLDKLVLHSSNTGRLLYERLGFVASNEMQFVGSFSGANPELP